MQIQTVHGSQIRTRSGSKIHKGGTVIRFGNELTFGTVNRAANMNDRLYGAMYDEADGSYMGNSNDDNSGGISHSDSLQSVLSDDGKKLYSMLKGRDKKKYERYYRKQLSQQGWSMQDNGSLISGVSEHMISSGNNVVGLNQHTGRMKKRGSEFKRGTQRTVRSVTSTVKAVAKTTTGAAVGTATLGTGTIVMGATETIAKTAKTVVKTAKKTTDKMQQQTIQNMQTRQEIATIQSKNISLEQEEKKKSSQSSMIYIFIVAIFIVMFIFTSMVSIGGTVEQAQMEQETNTGVPCTKITDAAEKELRDQSEIVGGYRYKNWYGMDDNWCAMFVSYCADRCGFIESGIMPKTASVAAMKQWYMNRGLFQSASSGYQPKAGDVIIFGNGMSHTGIVTGYDSETKTVTTIEGNSGRSSASPYHKGSHVKEHHYPLSYAKIAGYGTPQYPEDDTESGDDQINKEAGGQTQ